MTATGKVLRCLSRWEYDLSTEKALQSDVAKALTLEGIAFKREAWLNIEDRVEFYLPVGSIGLEVRLQCAAREIYRQIERYAESPAINEIILLSNTEIGLPGLVKGKRVWVSHAGKCGL